MALADAVLGAKRPSPSITWGDDAGLDLTGATITARLRNKETGGVVASDGVFTVTNGPARIFRWDYSTADVAIAGVFEVQFTATFGSAPTPAKTFVSNWQVHEAI